MDDPNSSDGMLNPRPMEARLIEAGGDLLRNQKQSHVSVGTNSRYGLQDCNCRIPTKLKELHAFDTLWVFVYQLAYLTVCLFSRRESPKPTATLYLLVDNSFHLIHAPHKYKQGGKDKRIRKPNGR